MSLVIADNYDHKKDRQYTQYKKNVAILLGYLLYVVYVLYVGA